MLNFSYCTLARLDGIFRDVRQDYLVSTEPLDTVEKVEAAVISVKLYPIACSYGVEGKITFTVCPYRSPSTVPLSSHFEVAEIRKIFESSLYGDRYAPIGDRWGSVNQGRKFVQRALNKALAEVLSSVTGNNGPIVEIGSGIGYTTGKVTNLLRTQPDGIECAMLKESTKEPIYNLSVQGIRDLLARHGKKVPLFFALDVFDTLTPEERKKCFLQLSQLQNPGDKIVLILDTNPCFENVVEEIKAKYPGLSPVPYFPENSDPAKLSFALLPKDYLSVSMTAEQLYSVFMEERIEAAMGRVSPFQAQLSHLHSQKAFPVIYLEDFFAKEVQEELSSLGYKTICSYLNAFSEGEMSRNAVPIKQVFAYRPVTDTAAVRQWDPEDPVLVKDLEGKGLKPPSYTPTELVELRKKGQKILGAELLVIEATKAYSNLLE